MEALKEIALPKIKGNPVDQLPENLYVPPKALLLLLDVFSGPMDFLLYLIQRKNLDILEVNLVDITDQYIAYIEMMEDFEYELAGDYLAMAAYLAEIKSRILLPREEESEEQEGDPKAELLRRLQEYKRFKEVSFKLDEMPRIDRDIFPASGKLPEFELPKPKNNYDKNDLTFALRSMLDEMVRLTSHKVKLENITVESKMKLLLDSLKERDFISLPELILSGESKLAVSVILTAALELNRKGYVEIVQAEQFGEIYFKGAEEVVH